MVFIVQAEFELYATRSIHVFQAIFIQHRIAGRTAIHRYHLAQRLLFAIRKLGEIAAEDVLQHSARTVCESSMFSI